MTENRESKFVSNFFLSFFSSKKRDGTIFLLGQLVSTSWDECRVSC